MITNGMSDSEQIYASMVGRALIEVMEEDICSRDDLRKAAKTVKAATGNSDLAEKLEGLAEAFAKTHAGPEVILEEVLRK